MVINTNFEKKAIEIVKLSGGYDKDNHQVLHNLSFTVNLGSYTALCGPNGAGKTTIIKYLLKERVSLDQSIFLFGKNINTIKNHDIPKIISYVGQESNYNYNFTVSQLVEMGRYGNMDSNITVNEALETVGIENMKNRYINCISSGELQLVLIARAICQDAKILVLDEPVSNLDPYHQVKIMNILRKLNKRGKTILCVLHNLNMVLNYCPNCIIIKDGTKYAEGKSKEIINTRSIYDVYNISSKIFKIGHDHTQITFYDNQYSQAD